MRASMRKLRASRIDLMQVHNLPDVEVHPETLAGWKPEGLARYLGVTHYAASAHADVARVLDCDNWARLLLRFVVSHPAMTCAIPATSPASHLRDNMKAGLGRLPDAPERAAIALVA